MEDLHRLEYACFLNHSGYSQAAQNYIYALDKTGRYDIKVSIFGDRPSKPSISDDKYEYFMKMIRKEGDNRILIYHCIPNLQRRIKQNKKNSIGFATFETYQPPDEWAHILNNNDAIVTPSEFNYRIFSHMPIKKPIYYIPHSIDFDKYNIDVSPLYAYEKFTFLFMGIWKERKGYKQLIEAWLREFSTTDNVQLLIKTDRPHAAVAYIDKYKKEIGIKQGFAPIIVENKVFDEKDLPRFIKSVNCLISPTMGEGFGYPGLQCMALGIPVIITNFSGCQDYANNDTSVLIEPSGFVLKNNMDGIPQFRNKKWAFIEVSKIRKAMRYALNNPKILENKSRHAYRHVRNRFDYSIVEHKFSNMIREVYGKY